MTPMQVEVIIQDYFFAEADLAADELAAGELAPIDLATWESWFQTWLTALDPDLSPIQAYELSLRLTDDAEIRSLNAQYRQKDQPTDVLAFAALEAESILPAAAQQEMPLYLGDMVISVETAKAQAQQQGHSLTQELAWLAAHALLHLLGWDHPDEASLLNMLRQQEVLLQTIGLSSSYYQDDDPDSDSETEALSIHS